MVFFTCNACGESMKKAQVEKHVNICRGCETLSCIDCGKDFWGDDYKNHLKCISEDQKYGGKGFEAKSNKGDVKQQQWIQRIHEAMGKPGIGTKLKDVLSQVSSYDNVPRKKAKFQNWMKNSLKIYNTALHDQVWEIFSEATSNASAAPKHAVTAPTESAVQLPASTQMEGNTGQEAPSKEKKNKRERKEERQKKGKKKRGEENGVVAEEGEGSGGTEKQRKKRKRKRDEEETSVGNEEGGTENGHSLEEETVAKKAKKFKKGKKGQSEDSAVEVEQKNGDDDDGEPNPKGKFNWKGTIKAVLKEAPEEGLAIKRLRKKVLAAYYSFSGDGNHKSEEELLALFSKKVKNNPKFRVLKEKVRLIKS